jgi:hypothetical protein
MEIAFDHKLARVDVLYDARERPDEDEAYACH